jgi:ADP-ribose pyrophosphatase
VSTDGAEVLGRGQHLRLVRRGRWEYAERNHGSAVAVVIAITDDRRMVLVEQLRPPVGKPVVELPAGLVGDQPGAADEALLDGARRELLEETGYQAGAARVVMEGPSSAGLTSEVVTFVRARDLRRVGPGGGEGDEAITVHEVPLGEIDAWLAAAVRRGRLVDPKVYAALYLIRRDG